MPKNLVKIFHLGLLYNVTTLALNVATLVVSPPGTSRCWISTLRRQFFPSLERRDVRSQRRDVGFRLSLKRLDVAFVLGQKLSHLDPTLIQPCLHFIVPPLSSPPPTLSPRPLLALVHPLSPTPLSRESTATPWPSFGALTTAFVGSL